MQAMTSTAQTILDALAGVAYATDDDGRIDIIGRRGWSVFAADNSAPDVAERERYLGRNLFDFISGDEVRTAYGRLLHRIRRGEPLIVVPCRCDAPTVSRDMRMCISPIKHRGVHRGFLFQSIALTERTRPPIRLFDFPQYESDYSDAVPLLGMCSLCERVCPEINSEQWLEAEAYYAHGGSSQVRISHTVCTSCFRRWVEGWSGVPPAY